MPAFGCILLKMGVPFFCEVSSLNHERVVLSNLEQVRRAIFRFLSRKREGRSFREAARRTCFFLVGDDRVAAKDEGQQRDYPGKESD